MKRQNFKKLRRLARKASKPSPVSTQSTSATPEISPDPDNSPLSKVK